MLLNYFVGKEKTTHLLARIYILYVCVCEREWGICEVKICWIDFEASEPTQRKVMLLRNQSRMFLIEYFNKREEKRNMKEK